MATVAASLVERIADIVEGVKSADDAQAQEAALERLTTELLGVCERGARKGSPAPAVQRELREGFGPRLTKALRRIAAAEKGWDDATRTAMSLALQNVGTEASGPFLAIMLNAAEESDGAAAATTEQPPDAAPATGTSLKELYTKMAALEEALKAGIMEKSVYDGKMAMLRAQLFPAARKLAAANSGDKLDALEKALAADIVTREEYEKKKRELSAEAGKPWPNDLDAARRMVAVERAVTDGALTQEDGQKKFVLIMREVGLGQVAEEATDRAERASCLGNLYRIERAKSQYAMEKDLAEGTAVTKEQITKHLENGWDACLCPKGGTYQVNPIGTRPTCNVSGHVWNR